MKTTYILEITESQLHKITSIINTRNVFTLVKEIDGKQYFMLFFPEDYFDIAKKVNIKNHNIGLTRKIFWREFTPEDSFQLLKDVVNDFNNGCIYVPERFVNRTDKLLKIYGKALNE